MEIALQVGAVTKRYGGVVALEDGQLTLKRGEVHVLLGSNGCGKSTLCKIIAGAVTADAGDIVFDGSPVDFRSPREARGAGIATVYQEMSLIPTLSVADNILLGREPLSSVRQIDRAQTKQLIDDIIESVGELAIGLDRNALVGELSIDQQQIVEIIKAIAQDPKIIIFDEPTSSLDRSQVQGFFELIRRIKDRGISVIFISHRMEEIFSIGDRVTIMRNGRSVATLEISETNHDELLNLMVGENITTADTSERPVPTGDFVLRAEGLSGGKASGVSLELRRGELLGFGGLHGQGQSDVLLTLYGATAKLAGSVKLDGNMVEFSSPSAALAKGLVYVSGDRSRAGALGGRPILENLVLALLSRRRSFYTSRSGLRKEIGPLVERLKIKFGGYSHPIETLSGGNQQKVVLGRALATKPQILLLDDPTKGIDVQTKKDLYGLLHELCADGVSVILYSSEDTELLDNADRVLVFNSGHVVEEIARQDLSEFALYSAALKSAALKTGA